jgi:glycogen synthase kinase 3 beta
VIREKVQDGITGETKDLQYTQCKIVGNGSFGVVFQTKLSPSGEDAAIKRVLQDKRFKNRELQIMRIVRHPNIVQLKAFYYSNGERVSHVPDLLRSYSSAILGLSLPSKRTPFIYTSRHSSLLTILAER